MLNLQNGVVGFRYSSTTAFTSVGELVIGKRLYDAGTNSAAYANFKCGMLCIGSELTEVEAKSLSAAILAFGRATRTFTGKSDLPWSFLGDSITYRYFASSSSKQWSRLVAAARGVTEYNFGSPSSATTFDSGAGSPIIGLVNRYQDMLALDFGKVIVEYGVNDAQADSTTNGDATKIATYQAGFTSILQALVARYGASKIAVFSTAWRTDKNSTFNTAWNNAMSAACAAAGVTFGDFYSYFISQGSPAGWMQDTVHFNDTGNTNFSNFVLTVV